jgi:exonuclease VII small subunit
LLFEKGVLLFEKGVLPFEKGVLPFEKGVLPFEKGVLLFEKGVLLFEKGVLLFEKGVLLQDRSSEISLLSQTRIVGTLIDSLVPRFSSLTTSCFSHRPRTVPKRIGEHA